MMAPLWKTTALCFSIDEGALLRIVDCTSSGLSYTVDIITSFISLAFFVEAGARISSFSPRYL